VELEALDHVGLVVSDMSRSVRWYEEVAATTTYEPAPA
jgi:catechol 2,3-dioxygenase-like lactoylglutathione lyase family enzyme